MKELLKKKCIPCEAGVEPFTEKQAKDYLAELAPSGEAGGTERAMGEKKKKISKEYKFKDFIGAINFVQKVADLAEAEGHHPDIHIHYNRVMLDLWTHAIGGLSENDFILAAKIDASN